MAKVELKQPIVAEIAELFNGAKSAVVVDYRGLTVEQDTALRKKLREADVTYKVYKNTMIRFAEREQNLKLSSPIWKDRLLSLYPRPMRLLRQEFWLSLPRRLTSWN